MFWKYVTRIILRYRTTNLLVIFLLTSFMLYHAFQVKLSYEMVRMLPQHDSTTIVYEKFKSQFGQDGSILFIGVEDSLLYTLDHFNKWFDLSEKLKTTDGIEEVISITRLFALQKDESIKKFTFKRLVERKPANQAEVDSLKNIILSQPFYNGLLYDSSGQFSLIAVTLNKEKLNSRERVNLIERIHDFGAQYESETNTRVHYSGLPYIRTITTKKVQYELIFFIILSLIISSLFMLIFFRSFKVVAFTMIIMAIAVIFVLGTINFLNYKITILTGILPPLLTVIVVENCIFLLNKYLHEYRHHSNKIKALSRTIQRIGTANFFTNAATATGFASFIATGNKMLVEFGIVATVNILVAFLLTIILIPIFFSFIKPPSHRQIRHLESGMVKFLLDKVVWAVLNRRKVIYVTTFVLIAISIVGLSKLKTTGNIVDDIPHKDQLYIDLLFFEKHINGVMPLEFVIDTQKKKGVLKLSTINRIEELQEVLAKYPELSKPMSLAEVFKSARQAFYGGDPLEYSIPGNQEKDFILSYVPDFAQGKKGIINSFIDSTMQITRISVQMANIGTTEIERIRQELRPAIDSIFPREQFNVDITGTSVVFLEGTNFLVKDLFSSLLIALIVISLLMALLFSTLRMILVSLFPNLIPQLITAGLMGFLAVTIKPSTVLIFSIALGISIDNAIQYLSRYRLHLRQSNHNINESAIESLKETGFSIIYSSIVLFFGFGIFVMSSFGGTQALGYLIAITLLMALLCNLFLLPSLLISLSKWLTTKKFEQPIIEIEDISENHPPV